MVSWYSTEASSFIQSYTYSASFGTRLLNKDYVLLRCAAVLLDLLCCCALVFLIRQLLVSHLPIDLKICKAGGIYCIRVTRHLSCCFSKNSYGVFHQSPQTSNPWNGAAGGPSPISPQMCLLLYCLL